MRNEWFVYSSFLKKDCKGDFVLQRIILTNFKKKTSKSNIVMIMYKIAYDTYNYDLI